MPLWKKRISTCQCLKMFKNKRPVCNLENLSSWSVYDVEVSKRGRGFGKTSVLSPFSFRSLLMNVLYNYKSGHAFSLHLCLVTFTVTYSRPGAPPAQSAHPSHPTTSTRVPSYHSLLDVPLPDVGDRQWLTSKPHYPHRGEVITSDSTAHHLTSPVLSVLHKLNWKT